MKTTMSGRTRGYGDKSRQTAAATGLGDGRSGAGKAFMYSDCRLGVNAPRLLSRKLVFPISFEARHMLSGGRAHILTAKAARRSANGGAPDFYSGKIR